MNAQYKIEALAEKYNPEHDLFSNQPIQFNCTDFYLLEIIECQQAQIEALETRLAKLEVFTGMTAPAPLPETLIQTDDDKVMAAVIRLSAAFELEDGQLTFAAGGVDEMHRPTTGMGEDEELPY